MKADRFTETLRKSVQSSVFSFPSTIVIYIFLTTILLSVCFIFVCVFNDPFIYDEWFAFVSQKQHYITFLKSTFRFRSKTFTENKVPLKKKKKEKKGTPAGGAQCEAILKCFNDQSEGTKCPLSSSPDGEHLILRYFCIWTVINNNIK